MTKLYEDRSQFLINERPKSIEKYYLEANTSRYAKIHEQKRSQYINAWAKKRGLDFTNAETSLRFIRIRTEGERAKAYLIQTLKLTYIYEGQPFLPHHFGIGTRHALTLKKVSGEWKVLSEWYTDPIEEDIDIIPADAPADSLYSPANSKKEKKQVEAFRSLERQTTGKKKRYHRDRAVAYAQKYA
ncbi:hypothetical protein ACI7RC_07405 [Brevibacillus sp. B_LB10_24]|uniref:hypothetical protein n=1 Tax=Brevibacillus sp. B_LB10_24 TaxID=3380645 RepID=UPI0038BCC8FE